MVNMQMVSTFPRSPDAHFVDIHEVPEEEEQEQEHQENGTGCAKEETQFNKPIKIREWRKPYRSFSRQVSLETGRLIYLTITSLDFVSNWGTP